MISHTTQRFRKLFVGLSKAVRKQVKEAYAQFRRNPYHPSLHFKRVHNTRPIYLIGITKNYRAVGIQQDDEIIWFWIGSHSKYSRLLKHRSTTMGLPAKKLHYPHLTSNPNIANGAPLIEGTRITVRTIAGYYQMGMNVDEILATLSHLSPAQVHSALAYYFDHQDGIDADLRDSSDEENWKQKVAKYPKEGV